MPEYFQSPKLSKILTELRYYTNLRSFLTESSYNISIHPQLRPDYGQKYRDLRAWKAGKFQTRTPLSVSYKAVLDHEITRPPKFALRLPNSN